MTADLTRQRLVDALQVVALRAETIERAARQQQQDASALLDAARVAVETVQAGRPQDTRKGGA